VDIKYRELNTLESAQRRCSVMLENHLQCPERASYSIIGGPKQMCTHHFMIATQLGNDNYIQVGADGKPIKGNEAKLPVAQQGAKESK
jgi:hypothetical protein